MTFLLNILFARIFSASASGQIFYLFAVFTFVIQAVGLSLESGIGFYSAGKVIHDGKLLGMMISWSAVASVLVVGIFTAIDQWGGGVNYPVIYPLSYVFGNLLINYGNAYCNSKYRYALPNIVQLSVTALLIILLLFSRYVHDTGIDFIALYFYSFLFQALLLVAGICLRTRPDFSFTFAELKPVINYSLTAFVANLITLGLHRIDYIFVKEYCSPDDLGNYIQVSRITQLCMLLPSMVSTVLFPFIVAGDKKQTREQVKKISLIFLVIFSAFCGIFAISGHWLFPFIYGESFKGMYVPFLLMAPGIVCICSLYPYATWHAANNNILVNTRGVLLAFAIVAAGNLLLVPHYGIAAAALVRSVGYFAFQFSIMAIFKKQQG